MTCDLCKNVTQICDYYFVIVPIIVVFKYTNVFKLSIVTSKTVNPNDYNSRKQSLWAPAIF